MINMTAITVFDTYEENEYEIFTKPEDATDFVETINETSFLVASIKE